MGNNGKVEALRSFNKLLQEKIKNLETEYFIESNYNKDCHTISENINYNWNNDSIYTSNYVLDRK